MSAQLFKTFIVTAVIGMLFYLVFSSIKKTDIFEGLTTISSDKDSKLKDKTDLTKNIKILKDKLSLDKRKQEYEDFIVNLEDACNLQILYVLYNASEPLDIKLLESVNTMNNAKSTLNDLMKYLDGQ